MERKVGDREELASLSRGLEAIAALNRSSSLTASQLGEQIGVSRTTARRVLDTLLAGGYVDKEADAHDYRLAPQVADLSQGLTADHILCHVASPLLHAATQSDGWPLSLVVVNEATIELKLSTARSAAYAITYYPLGARTPIHSSQAGKLLIAYMPDDERAALRATAGVSHDLTDVETEEMRERGYWAPINGDARESHVFVPIFIGERPRACIIMRYFKSALRRNVLIRHHLPALQDLSARITAGAAQAMAGRRPDWLDHFDLAAGQPTGQSSSA